MIINFNILKYEQRNFSEKDDFQHSESTTGYSL
jgi:hypothetical protein